MKMKLLSLVLATAQVCVFAGNGEDYVAHEWGTFTSVQGADGVQLEWNPLVTSELPGFVYEQNKVLAAQGLAPALPGKDGFVTLQRMETPVIYFYSSEERKVDVAVNFPQGLITEWFPHARDLTVRKKDTPPSLGRKNLQWDAVQVLPAQANTALAATLPMDASGSHYYAARETDAELIRVIAGSKEKPKTEVEKFLFYRGVGHFRAPLMVTVSGDDSKSIRLQNTGKEELRHLFIYQLRQGQGHWLHLSSLARGAARDLELQPERDFISLSDLRVQVGRQMQAALVKEGLFEHEAAAMVRTWDDSWFAEPGLRVLYALPRPWTDRVLPLTLNPKPRQLVRVMVGRAEVITPAMEWELLKQIVRFSDDDAGAKSQAVANVRALGLGRFMEPTLRRVLGKNPSKEFSQVSWTLLKEASKPAADVKVASSRKNRAQK